MSDRAYLPAPAAGARWWVEAAGRTWGPYPVERLARFLAEGRLGAASRVAQTREGPFRPAATEPELASLFPEAEPAPTSEFTGLAASEPRPFLVAASPEEAVCATVEAALDAHGPFVRVRAGLWLVRARENSAALRNALSRRLGGGDALLIAEASLASAAWFNLDGETDRALRRLWAASIADAQA